MRILVFSLPHEQFTWMSTFPHVRGHVLAKYLRRLGEDAEFRATPVEGHYDVAICSDYQGDARWLGVLQRRMKGLSARRMFCMSDSSAIWQESLPMLEWFAQRGGVLCHMQEGELAPYQHFIGLGVDEMPPDEPAPERCAVFFDLPRSQRKDASANFPVEGLDAVRRAHPGYRLLGSGPADSPHRDAFDEWIAYGLPHDDYVRTFWRCRAFVPGWKESLGLVVAEAQVGGAAIVAPPRWIKPDMLVPAAAIIDGDPVRGLERAAGCDAARIVAEAGKRFSPTAMARRALDAIRAVG